MRSITSTIPFFRPGLDCAIALVLWLAISFAGNFSVSERIHIVLPLAWVVDAILFRREAIAAYWPYIIVVTVLALVGTWTFLVQRANEVGGRVQFGEFVWWFLFWFSLIVLYQLLSFALSCIIGLYPGALALLKTPNGWWLRAIRAVISLVLFGPYLHTATNVHRNKSANATNPLRECGLNYETVSFAAADDGVNLSGWFIPASNSTSTVMICHGISANKGNFLAFAPMLHRAGFNVLMFDFRGHGDSAGHTITFGYYEARDVRGALRYLNTRPDSRHIAALACSMGGSALLHAAGDVPELRGAVVDSTFADLYNVARLQMRFLPPSLQNIMLPAISAATRLEVGISLNQISPRSHIAQLSPRPLLLIHGDLDGLIPTSQAQELFAAAREPKEFWNVPGAGHVGAMAVDKAAYEQRVATFLKQCMTHSTGS